MDLIVNRKIMQNHTKKYLSCHRSHRKFCTQFCDLFHAVKMQLCMGDWKILYYIIYQFDLTITPINNIWFHICTDSH